MKTRILIIDEDRARVIRWGAALEAEGLLVVTAHTAVDGLRELSASGPQVVVASNGPDGAAVAAAVRDARPSVPVLTMGAQEEGALVALVQAALERHRLQRRVAELEQRTKQLTDAQAQSEPRAIGIGLVGGIAHDLNNPLTVLLSNSVWLEGALSKSLSALHQALCVADAAPDKAGALEAVLRLHRGKLAEALAELSEVLAASKEAGRRAAAVMSELQRLVLAQRSPVASREAERQVRALS